MDVGVVSLVVAHATTDVASAPLHADLVAVDDETSKVVPLTDAVAAS